MTIVGALEMPWESTGSYLSAMHQHVLALRCVLEHEVGDLVEDVSHVLALVVRYWEVMVDKVARVFLHVGLGDHADDHVDLVVFQLLEVVGCLEARDEDVVRGLNDTVRHLLLGIASESRRQLFRVFFFVHVLLDVQLK